MNIENKTKGLVESAITGTLAAIIVFAIALVPVFYILRLLIVVPYIIVGRRYGSRYAILSSTVTATLIGLFMNPVEGIYIMTMGGFVAFAVIKALQYKDENSVAMLAGSIATMVGMMLFITIIFYAVGIDLNSEFKAALDIVMTETIENYKTSGNEQLYALFTNNEIDLKSKAVEIIPSMFAAMSIFYMAINLWISKLILRRVHITLGSDRRFSEFLLPKSVIYGSLISIITIYGIGLLGVGNIEIVLFNVMNIFMMVYSIAGMSVVWWFAEEKKVHVVLRILIIGLFMVFGAMWLLSTLGLVDRMFNLRKLDRLGGSHE